MRHKFNPQMNLFSPIMRSSIVKELEQISTILDATPTVMDLVFQDLVKTHRPDTGRKGMTAEQVLRCAILKQYRELTYEELAFHLEDSDAFRSFPVSRWDSIPRSPSSRRTSRRSRKRRGRPSIATSWAMRSGRR